MDLWRISNHVSLNGEGGRRAPARWHSGGSPVVYLAASPPGSLIEILVHLDLRDVIVPLNYTLLRVAVPDKLQIPSLKILDGDTWREDESRTRKLGDAWLRSSRSALARVPSAILPDTFNYLLNPLHPDASRIKVAATKAATLDRRLLR